MMFCSPSKGELSFNAVFDDLISYTNNYPEEKYKLIIGSDSHALAKEYVIYVTAIIAHRIGKGGRFYFHKQKTRYMEACGSIYYKHS